MGCVSVFKADGFLLEFQNCYPVFDPSNDSRYILSDCSLMMLTPPNICWLRVI